MGEFANGDKAKLTLLVPALSSHRMSSAVTGPVNSFLVCMAFRAPQ